MRAMMLIVGISAKFFCWHLCQVFVADISANIVVGISAKFFCWHLCHFICWHLCQCCLASLPCCLLILLALWYRRARRVNCLRLRLFNFHQLELHQWSRLKELQLYQQKDLHWWWSQSGIDVLVSISDRIFVYLFTLMMMTRWQWCHSRSTLIQKSKK